MLDAFIIEEIRRRERLRQEHDDRPVVELPLPSPDDRMRRRPEAQEEDAPKRGVVIIDLAV
jgi:hypothetical protein